MNTKRTIPEHVSDLNRIMFMIIDNPEIENHWINLKNAIANLKENGYDILQIPFSSITIEDPTFFEKPDILHISQLLNAAIEKKLKAVKCQQYETAAGYRDQEKYYGSKMLELYKELKGKDFGYFINVNEKIIVYINSWNNTIDNEVNLLINKF